MTFRGVFAAGLLGGVVASAAAPAVAQSVEQSVEQFYRSKSLDVIISGGVGGGYDAYGRLVSRHMARFIPGTPTVVPRNMPGAGHRIAANYLYNLADKDGSVIGTIGQILPMQQVLGRKGIRFDSAKFNFIGNPNEGNNTVAVWAKTGVRTVADAKKKEVIIGGTSTTGITVVIPRAMNNILGTKFKIIAGFRSGNQINLAMERGEVQGRGSLAWASLTGTKYEWLRDKKVNLLVQVGLEKEKELPDVPLLTDLATNEAERRVFEMISAGVRIGRPIVAPPDVPEERVAALRNAFDRAMADPKFLAEAKRSRLDIRPVPGVEVQKVVARMVEMPEDVVQLTKAAITKGEVFNCLKVVKDAKLCRSKKKKGKKKPS